MSKRFLPLIAGLAVIAFLLLQQQRKRGSSGVGAHRQRRLPPPLARRITRKSDMTETSSAAT